MDLFTIVYSLHRPLQSLGEKHVSESNRALPWLQLAGSPLQLARLFKIKKVQIRQRCFFERFPDLPIIQLCFERQMEGQFDKCVDAESGQKSQQVLSPGKVLFRRFLRLAPFLSGEYGDEIVRLEGDGWEEQISNVTLAAPYLCPMVSWFLELVEVATVSSSHWLTSRVLEDVCMFFGSRGPICVSRIRHRLSARLSCSETNHIEVRRNGSLQILVRHQMLNILEVHLVSL